MPELRLLVASGTTQRNLLQETVSDFEKKGYVLRSRQEGGEWATVLSDNMSVGLFDENILVVVDSAELMGAMPEKLSSLIEDNSSVVIILVYDSLPTKLIPKEILKKIPVIKAMEIPRWPNERQIWLSRLVKDMNISMTRDAISLIVEMIEDTEEIKRQLLSLSMLKKQGEVTSEDVELLCFDDGNRNLLKLLDGICEGDTLSSLKSLHSISKKGDLFPLLSALHNRMRLAWYAACNPGKEDMFANVLEARNYAWRKAREASKRYGKKNITEFVMGLIRLNMEEKSGIGAGWNSLESLVISLLENK